MFAMATTVAADCDKPSDPGVTKTPAANTTANKISGMRLGLFPCMRNHLDTSSVAQSLDGIGRLAGSLRFPVGSKLGGHARRRKFKWIELAIFILSLFQSAATAGRFIVTLRQQT